MVSAPSSKGARAASRGGCAIAPWSLARRLAVLVAMIAAALSAGAGVALAQNPVGAHSMLQLDDPPSFMEAMFAQAAAMHAESIRLDVAPALVFPSPSRPADFTGLDEVVTLAKTYHLRVVADLMTVPTWMSHCATPTGDGSRCGAADLTDYASVVGQIVTRADPVIRDWEVWNEPDTSEFFDGTPEQYAFLLRTAHDAIKAIDPGDDVLLGGISGVAGMSWLTQVFQTPGADAVHAFDTANVHERGDLWTLAPDLASWRRFFAASGFAGPLWVTEHGYPADAPYQYDPGYTGGDAAQAAYLAASIPTLVDAGASEVFVTERDNLGGQFGSEGILGGQVSDPAVPDPQIVRRPSYAVVQALADCYQALWRDCPDAPVIASPARAVVPPVPPGRTSTRSLTVTNPGAEPIVLGAAALTGSDAAGLSVASNGCAGEVLEPREKCPMRVLFAPAAGGDVAGRLKLDTGDGPLEVPVVATAPSLSALRSPQLPRAAFAARGGGDGIGYPQRLVLTLTNPLAAAVAINRASVSGPDARRFAIPADRCVHMTLAPRRSCRLSVLFTPKRAGVALAQITLEGTGSPLIVQLRPVAFPLPTVTALAPAGRDGCAMLAGAEIAAATNQPALVHWTLAPAAGRGRRACRRATTPGGLPVARGTVATAHRHRAPGGAASYAARWPLAGRAALRPGLYVLTAIASDRHGAGPARSVTVTITR